MRQITSSHVTAALTDRQGHQARGVHHVLLGVFRALKHERIVFTDRSPVSLTTPVRLPEPLPSDLLRGLLDSLDSPMGRPAIGLVAVHAIKVTDVARLPLAAPDLARGTLRLRLREQPHAVCLDRLTRQLLDDWLRARQQRWPASPNPHLLITTHFGAPSRSSARQPLRAAPRVRPGQDHPAAAVEGPGAGRRPATPPIGMRRAGYLLPPLLWVDRHPYRPRVER
ncbi:hypothetical protein [Streptomyces adelaidensis]|uniref:hypothetical protein n=1 Tax=Streptomyces adelaidensis TaxID=2796465 RepID=UPI001906D438|nr:hypothetical protein [Streptomyces adelaidensis]